MTFEAAVGIYIIFLVTYWFFVYSILWHLKEYIVPNDNSKWVIRGFVSTVVILNAISLILFLQLPLK